MSLSNNNYLMLSGWNSLTALKTIKRPIQYVLQEKK